MSYARYLLVLAFFSGASFSQPAAAGIYAFADANGVIHYTNMPSYPRYAGMKQLSYLPGPAARQGWPADRQRFSPLVAQAARDYQLDQALLHAVITAESGYDPYAVSDRGAVGLMQLMPQTAQRYGVRNPRDPAQNIRGGARYLRDLMEKFDNNLTLTLAAYNAGEQAVVRHGNRVPPYHETRSYVPRVLGFYREYQRNAR